ncbi:response regulator transcription factor [Solirubrobacter phytolaccae]|uniref:Response regulator transcription factor n=1 Tax=Solirubrobacter phytolaccae TaxID=1404360 RepID=A0A9X3SB47_9ACTN|nr:response regulator transcription factor [Solirubrobacter phytolaccae]MDA0184368.1 response regulator transcription factor [Solirubrobacter phytolaccae]
MIPRVTAVPPLKNPSLARRHRLGHSVRRVIFVVLADPQPLFRDAVARVIRQDPELQLVAEVSGGRAALAAVVAHDPDVALVARDLPDLDGERVLAATVREHRRTRVVLLDSAPGPDAWSLLGDGAAGVLSRRVAPDALRAAVHRVARGETALCDEAQTALAAEVRARSAADRPLLSPREQQVLDLVADGLSAPQIASRLQVATSTVRTHHKHLLVKLDAHDRAQLVRHAMRRKLLD